MLADLSVNIPVFSAVLLLIAGILIGYALWFPFRGDSESIAKQLGNLQEQNDDLQDALHQQRDAYARLERKHHEQLNEWTSLRSSNQRMEAAIRDQSGVREDLEAGVKSLHDLRDATLRELDQEKQKRQKLESALRASRAALVELQSANEDYRQLQSKYDALVEKYETARALAKGLASEREQIACELVTTTEELQQAYRERQLSEASVTETDRTVDQLKEAVRSQRARADQLQCELTEARQELTEQREEHRALEATLEDAQDSRDQNQHLRETIVGQQKQVMELQQALDASREQLQELLADRDATQVEFTSRQELQQQLQDDLECHQRTIHTIERQRDAFRADVLAHANRVKELEDELQHASKDLQELAGLRQQHLAGQIAGDEARQQLRSLKLDRDEHAQALADEKDARKATEARLTQAERKNEQLRDEREQLATSLTSEEKRRAEVERLLEQQATRFNSLTDQVGELDEIRGEVQTLRAQVLQLADQGAAAKAEIHAAEQKLQSESARAEDLRQRLAESHERLLTLREDQPHGLQQLREERDAARAAAERAQAIIAELREELKEDRQLIASLQADREPAMAEFRRGNVMVTTQGENSQIQPPLTKVHGRRGVIYTREPERKDDLTQISGIGRVLEEKLNDFGIYTYAQIMDWDPAVIEEFSKLLAFPDRITRDDWLGQARRLHNERREQSDAA